MEWLPSHRDHRSVRLPWVFLLLVVVGSALWGCGRGSFIGRQYDDFTAYFNTFYNATKAFEKGLQSVEKSTPSVDRDQYISIYPDPPSSPGGKSFEKTIQKCADLLREHPNSRWADNALLLIGRSYYYQKNYVGAVQKFREVIALESEREGEARFRLAQTLVAAERYADAAEALAAGLNSEADYGTWTDRMYLVRGELLVRQNRWEDAENALERGLEGALPDDTAARAAFLLGQVRETLDDFDGALAAYRQVPNYDPKYPLEFAARLNAIELQGLHGNAAEALRRLEDLKRGDDTKEMRGQMAIVRARLYAAQGQPRKARRVLENTLRGEETPSGATQGELHYELGTLYRDAYEDFTKAAAHFDTASTKLSSRGGRGRSENQQRPQALPRAPSDAASLAERFQGLADRAQAVARMDSLLRLGRMDPAKFQAFVEKLRKRRQKKQEAQAQKRRDQQFRTRGTAGRNQDSSQPQNAAIDTRGSDAGFLFHRDPTLVQRGRRQFRQKWGDRPLVDNWRRKVAIQGGTTASAGQEQEDEFRESGQQGPSKSLVDLSAVPRDSASQAEMEDRRAVAQYELGNALFRAAGRPDSAETWYKRVLKENEDHPVARKALYALAQSYEAQGDTTAAQDVYRRVIEEYPGTAFAKRSRKQLGLDRTSSAGDLATSRADSAYARAYEMWQAGRWAAAFDSLLTVAEGYPQTTAAPRSLLAAGVIYHRTLQRDSAQDLRPRLERSLDRLAPPDSGAGSAPGERPDTTASKREPVSSPDSTVVDTTADTTTPPQAVQGADTTDTAPRKRPADSSIRSGERPPRRDTRSQDSTRRANDSTGASSPGRLPQRPRAPKDSSASDSTTPPPADTVKAAGADTSATRGKERGGGRAATAPETTPDSAQAASGPSSPIDPLKALFTHVSQQYSGTPYAKQARSLLKQLKQQTTDSTTTRPAAAQTSSGAGAAPDSSTTSRTAPTDRAPSAPRRTPADSTADPRRASADTARAGAERGQPRTRNSTVSPRTEPRSQVRADSARGGWTLLLRTFEEAARADRLRRRVEQRLSDRWSARVVTDSTGTQPQHHLTVGHFTSEQQAAQAKTALPEPLREKSKAWIPPAHRKAQK
ncbi:MAG: tetratricopeptide repeat protein [Salinibacter sp.]|uniref:type IX secretion system periplasmic lipoprotein PorW/SprE n=1 Tax=Salinibacter sp. TaxID=2065818 RepID=UPI0035D41694